LSGIAVEALHPHDGIGKVFRGCLVALEGGCDDACAKRFGEEESVAGAGAGFGQQTVAAGNPEHDQPEFRFIILDRMSTGDDRPSFAGFFRGAADDSLGELERQRGREGGDVEGEERLAAHRVNVRKGICGSNRAVIVGVIHNRGEKVHRGDEGLLLVETPNSSVISGIEPDEQFRAGNALESFFDWQQNLRQRFRVDFRSSTRAGGERSQADGWVFCHAPIIPDFQAFCTPVCMPTVY